ncbi:hypothetical protein D3C79_1007840 [compost metagenome]
MPLLTKSNRTIKLRRLKRSAIAPPNGVSKIGRLEIAKSTAKRSARPVMSKTKSERANLKSAEPKIEII